MLNNDFFYTRSVNSGPGIVNATFEINPTHPIFNGHFPGQPVVPGVCMVQIIKELLEGVLGKSLQLQKADHIKFLSMIVPRTSDVLEASITYSIDGNAISVVSTLTKRESVCLKLRGNFVVV
ncbi:MAG TPA: 3-hydroxyacyl-ACP dehydratase [Agriterribacter sp.]|nr:3-hydroxyacyl-ACP dehydratase [Agriterribacter sp.]